MNKAYVVGYGLIDALGNNPADCFNNMLNDIDYTTDLDFMLADNHKINRGLSVDPTTIILPENTPKALTKVQQLAIHATEQALQMSGLPHSDKVAVIFSTILNETESLDVVYPGLDNDKRIHPRTLLNRIPDMICNHISIHYQFTGVTTSMFAACASGITSIDYAMRLLDEYDYVIVGSGDAGCFRFAMKYFAALGAMGNTSRPFDDSREGFVMGDGAGVLVLQSKHMVKKYNSTVHATLYPAGFANDAYNLTNPAPDFRGSKTAINKAMELVTGPIHAVNAHATSTPMGDGIEYDVIVDRLGAVPIYAPKSKIGHTMAGSGIVETIYAIESMKNKIIPHIHNLTTTSIDTHNCLVRENTPYSSAYTLRTLNNSFGFGGKCASQVIEV